MAALPPLLLACHRRGICCSSGPRRSRRWRCRLERSLPALTTSALPCAVYIDGAKTATFNSVAIENGGWFAAATGAPSSAPFDIPFSLIL